MKKKGLLTVKELAAELRMSLKSIQRAYRKGEIPVQWLGRMAPVQSHQRSTGDGTQWTKPHASSQEYSDTAGRNRRRSRRRAQQNSPRSVKRGVLKRKAKVRSSKSDHVFPSDTFTLLDHSHLRRAFRRAMKLCRIGNFHFHDLRHTFATRLVQAGIDLYKVQCLLGHKAPIMTQRYAHHYP